MKQLLLLTNENVLGEVAGSGQMKQLHVGKFLCAICGLWLSSWLPPT